MAKQRIHTEQAPRPVGPCSQAVAVDGWHYVAGQVPIDPATGNWVKGDIAAQTERVLQNVQAILAAAKNLPGGAKLEVDAIARVGARR